MPGADPFMEWAVETVLSREVRELTSFNEKNESTITLLNDDLKNWEYENVGLQGDIGEKDQQIAALERRFVGYL